MATISKINGMSDPSLMAHVDDTNRPRQDFKKRSIPLNNNVVNKAIDQLQSVEIKGEKVDSDQIKAMTAKLQASIDRVSKDPHHVGFHIDAHSNQYVIEIKNMDGSVIKQFPPEKVLNLMKKLDDLSGMVIDAMT